MRACLKACEHISTVELEAGLVHAVFDAYEQVTAALAIASRVARQGKNPAHYVDLVGLVRKYAPLNGQLEASGYSEAKNRAWERRTGQSLDERESSVLEPLRTRRQRA
jgi:hypothetical protein